MTLSKYISVGPSALGDYGKAGGQVDKLSTIAIAYLQAGCWSDYIRQSGAIYFNVLGIPVTVAPAGNPYSFDIEVINGTAPFQYFLQGAWPLAITIDVNTGEFGGSIDLSEADKTFAELSIKVVDADQNVTYLPQFSLSVEGEPLAPDNTVAPSFTGTATVGQLLTGNRGTWVGVPSPTFSYKWQTSNNGSTGWTDISGATSLNYTIVNGDYGKYLRLFVTGTNTEGSDTAFSTASTAIAGLAPVATSSPTFTGTQTTGQTLSGSAGSWNGVPTSTYSYKWQRSSNGSSWSDISGATSINYTLVSADFDQYIRLIETATNAAGTNSEPSSASGKIAGIAPSNSVAPSFAGTTTVGQTVSGANGTWSGTPTPTYSYQWQRSDNGSSGWSNISGATSINYTIQNADYQKYLRLTVTATNAVNSATANSSASAQIAGIAPSNTVAPALSGTARVDQTLSTTNGTWNGYPAPAYTYQWQRSDNGSSGWSNISSATASTYVLTTSDYAKYVRCQVTATNAVNNATANSSASAQIAGTIPVNTVAPAVSGTTTVDQTLTGSSGTWTGYPSISYAYKWQRSSNGTSSWADISGATNNTRVLVSGDYDQYLRIHVTATNAAGSNTATSSASAKIAGYAPDNTAAPVVSGTETVGETLSTTNGTFTGVPSPTYGYQWQVSADGSTGWTNVGTNSDDYTLVEDDADKYFRCTVTGTNVYGSDSGTSNVVGPIDSEGTSPVNVTPPSFTGTAKYGLQLSGVAGSWSGDPTPDLTYQWQRSNDGSTGWTDISSATSINYTAVGADYQKYLRLVETASNIIGTNSEHSSSSSQVAGQAPSNTSAPSLSGTPTVGQTLSTTNGTWNAYPSVTYSYQWYVSDNGVSGWTPISGKTSSTYVVENDKFQKFIRARVQATNDIDIGTEYTSASAQIAGIAPSNSVAPAISGDLFEGEVLTTTNGTWSGVPTPTYSYQWQRSNNGSTGWTDISGQTADDYEATSSDIGKYIRCVVTGTNEVADGSANSNVLGPFEAAETAPVNTVAPSFSGTAQVGQTLTGSDGTWTGNPTPTYSYQWQVSNDGSTGWTNLSGATSSTYAVQAADYAKYIRLAVTGSNSVDTVQAFSSASAQIAGTSPANTVAPSISGTFTVGQTVSTTNGTWTGTPTPTYSYQWQISNDGSTGWTNISGATSSTYTIANGDYAKFIRCRVTGTNAVSAVNANSSASSAIAGLAPSNSVAPSVSGTAQVGQVLTSTSGTWSGVPTPTYGYQWQTSDNGSSGWTNISGATSSTYTVAATYYQKYLRCRVTATNAVSAVTAVSSATSQIAGTAPVNTAVPTISGTTTVGQTLTSTSGTWTGTPTPTYGYKWQRSSDGSTGWTDISGATSSTYTLQSGDGSNYVRSVVTGTNAVSSASANSAASAQIAASATAPDFGSISSSTYASRTNVTVTAPTGITNGNTLIGIVFCGRSGSALTPTAPAGWSQIGTTQTINDGGGFYVTFTAWKKTASSESGNYTWNHATASSQAFIARYTGSNSTVNAVSGRVEAPSNTTRTADSITTTVDNCRVLYAGFDWADNSNNEFPPTGMTERLDNTLSYLADYVQTTAGSTGSKTNTCNSINDTPRGAFLIALEPA